MATHKRSGQRRAAQLLASEASQGRCPYTALFERYGNLNRAFDQVLNEVEILRKMGVFWGQVSNRFPKTCRLMIEELRAWAIADMALDLHDSAERDWGRYGVQRVRFERKSKDSEDVLQAAERVQKKSARAPFDESGRSVRRP
jgi:predicted deacylase